MLAIQKSVLIVVLVFGFIAQKSRAVDIYSGPQEFCYDDPECDANSKQWNGICHSGKHQSPINLEVGHRWATRYIYFPMQSFVADHYFIQNNGHTVNMDFTPAGGEGSRIFPGYGLSKEKYRFSNAHLHWGPGDQEGSEHELNGRNFSMELHLVHFKEKYQTLKEAVASGEPNALAVVGIFLQVEENTPPNPSLQPIINLLPNIHETHTFWIRGDTPVDFTPLIPVRYGGVIFSYKGSLTTPTCDEVVNWFVFQDSVPIAQQDVEAFRQILDGREHTVKFNRRNVQPVNGRGIEVIGII